MAISGRAPSSPPRSAGLPASTPIRTSETTPSLSAPSPPARSKASRADNLSQAVQRVVPPGLVSGGLVGFRAQPAEGLGPALVGQLDHRGIGPGRGGDGRGDSHVLGQQPDLEPGPVAAGQHLGTEDLADEGSSG